MSRRATDIQECVRDRAQDRAQDRAPSPRLPADHVLRSGAVLFPGAFDQHGCPLIMFPVDRQDKLSSELSKAEVVDFINYFLCLHNKKQEKESLVSVVADLQHASLATVRFIAETLQLLELHKQTVHCVYMIQPQKKDVVKLLLKLLAPFKSSTAPFKKVLLKEIPELSNYIDRSQLTAPLGGYLIYCHQSWVAFIKEIDAFVQDFLSVVQRLPSCIATLHALSRLPLPTTFNELQHFCSTNEAKFQQLRGELGLDELLRHCESVVEKLRYPEREPCYQAMAGTALFTHMAFDMLESHCRITAAVEKVELLWQQAFSKAHLQLQVFQLRKDALQITEQINTLLQEKLQPYKMEIAKDDALAVMLVSEFEVSIHTPAMALVHCAEDVIHTLAEILPFDAHSREHWVLDLERLKEKLHSAVHFVLQTLRAVSSYHYNYNKACSWYRQVLTDNVLQELLSGVNGVNGAATQGRRRNWGSIPAWRHKVSTFLKSNPPPDIEELLHLAHLSDVIPDAEVQQAGRRMSQRCLTLRKLLMSWSPVAVSHLQLALQWQYELLRSSNEKICHTDGAAIRTSQVVQDPSEHSSKEVANHLGTSPSTAVSGVVSAECTPPSHSSFDSGFDGALSSPPDALGGREGVRYLSRVPENWDTTKPVLSRPQFHRDDLSNVSDSEDHREEFDFVSGGNSSRASIQVIPKVTMDSLNFEITVKRSAALPSNPWLSLPVDDLENSYTVTITQNPTLQKRDLQFSDLSDPCTTVNQSSRSGDQPEQLERLCSTQSRGPPSRGWMPHSHSTLEDPELSPIGKILSSTITDGSDKSVCTTEGIPSLLWDSYDLHDQNQDSVDGLDDMSLNDWDVKEQEGLREVERILDRTDAILEKEEKVLAQEAVLDALLRSEEQHDHWPLWDTADQQGVMSSSELAEAGVLGLEDTLVPAQSDNLGDARSSASASKTEAERHCTGAVEEADTEAFHSRPDLLSELRKVCILDELIMEESLKIHELRSCIEKPNEELFVSKALDTKGLSSLRKEKEAIRLQLEKEKKEVNKLEKSLGKESKVKKHKNRAKKVVKCSIMRKARTGTNEDRALCDELLSDSCNRSQRAQCTSVIHSHSQAQDTSDTQDIRAVTGPDVAEQPTPQDLVKPDSQSQKHSSKAEPSVFNKTLLNSPSDLKETPEDSAIQPQGCNHVKDLDSSGENATMCKPEASFTTQMKPDDGTFDPGGQPRLSPVPKPRKISLPMNENLAELETLHSTELKKSALSSVVQFPCNVQLDLKEKPPDALPKQVTSATSHHLVLSADMKEYSSNNNNNHALPEEFRVSSDSLPEVTAEDEKDMLGVHKHLPHTDFQPVEKSQTSSPVDESFRPQLAPQLPPEQHLELRLGGRDVQKEDLLHNVQSSEAMRSSESGIQAQLCITMKEMTDFKTPLVLDTGSGLMKAGFADQDLPNIIFPTIIGMPKYEEIMNGDVEREVYIGHEAQHMRGVLSLKHPIKNGIICNWDDMEKIWHHTFQQLCVDPEDHPVLLTEAAMNPLENRQRMVEIMFECFNVPFTYVAMQAVLALYTAGKTTGVVLDSGDGLSHSVPVFEGYCLPHAVQRFSLAGGDVTMHLKKLLQEQGVCMRTTAEMEIVREMKEKCCCVALNYEAELTSGGASCREMHYTMPDGQIVTLSTERFRAPEILFKPELIGRDHYGMHESVFKSILSSDIDLRRCFLGNIVLSGGNTLLSGLPERLQQEIKGLVSADMGESVHVTSPKDRDFSVWKGGAVLANLPSFSSAWISQEEYEEHGPQIVFRKCF